MSTWPAGQSSSHAVPPVAIPPPAPIVAAPTPPAVVVDRPPAPAAPPVALPVAACDEPPSDWLCVARSSISSYPTRPQPKPAHANTNRHANEDLLVVHQA